MKPDARSAGFAERFSSAGGTIRDRRFAGWQISVTAALSNDVRSGAAALVGRENIRSRTRA